MKKILMMLLIFLIITPFLYAQSTTVRLKSGKVVEGQLVERTDTFVIVNFNEIELTFWLDDIDEIDGVKIFSEIQPEKESKVEPTETGGQGEVLGLDNRMQEVSSVKPTVQAMGGPVETQSEETAFNFTSGGMQELASVGVMSAEESVVQQEVVSQSELSSNLNDTAILEMQQEKEKVSFSNLDVQSRQLVKPASGTNIAVAGSVLVVMLIVAVGFYVFFSYCFQRIAQKIGVDNTWLAWIPIANVYLMCKMAAVPVWWLILFFIPIVNAIISIIVWYKIILNLNKPGWYVVLLFVPLVNLALFVYLAFSKAAQIIPETEKNT